MKFALVSTVLITMLLTASAWSGLADPDCVRFDPTAVTVRQLNGRWKIVDRDHGLFDFGSDRSAAENALRVIRHYRLDRSCFVGRPDPSFVYMLARGGSPSGSLAGEDCVPFDSEAIRVAKVNQRWMILDHGRRLFDFGKKEVEARQALAVIRLHGFKQVCFVGRPLADFTYLRR